MLFLPDRNDDVVDEAKKITDGMTMSPRNATMQLPASKKVRDF